MAQLSSGDIHRGMDSPKGRRKRFGVCGENKLWSEAVNAHPVLSTEPSCALQPWKSRIMAHQSPKGIPRPCSGALHTMQHIQSFASERNEGFVFTNKLVDKISTER